MAVFLDTSVLPRDGYLFRNVLFSALRKICEKRSIEVCLPNLVVDESVNARRELASDASDRLRSALREAANFFELESIYLPDAEEAASQWRADLEEFFTIISVDPADACTALRREALRQTPASKGRGGRDTAIWLTVLRFHRDNEGSTYFISSNTDDFAASDKSTLHHDLLAELGDDASSYHYFRSVSSFVASLAEAFSYEPDLESLKDIADDFLTQLSAQGAFVIEGQEISPELFATARISDFADVRTLRAYSVDDNWLALLVLKIVVTFGNVDNPRSLFITMRCRSWIELESSTGPIQGVTIESASVESVATLEDGFTDAAP